VSRALVASAFAAGLMAAAAGWLLWPQPESPQRSSAELMDVVMWNKEPIGGPFTLIDHDARPRTDTEFRGQVLLVYFGFTFCSDICPIDLQSIAQAVDRLGPDGAVQPLFITIDPEKDTPPQLKAYVALIHPRLIGLTGDRRQISKVASDYRVFYAKSEPQKKGGSSIDHMSLVYVVGRDGKYVGFFPPGTSADRIVDTLRPLVSAPPQT
jgi:cytochrome oxidase Cu insertion factor (SCO1/SenC/PrrC family)